MDSILRILFSIFFAISIRTFSNTIISISMQSKFKIYISPNSIELWYISMEL